jgi:hypothetical protein
MTARMAKVNPSSLFIIVRLFSAQKQNFMQERIGIQ